jgi:tetratricopeptide (TPR) repeat protein
LTDYFEDLARFDLAEPHAQKAIDRSKTDLRKAHSYRVMADIRIQLGTQADALELLNNAISEVLENEAKARILDKVAEIHEAANDKLMAAKALEHALKLTPSDKGRRFKLAYIYSDHGRQHLALFHYRILADQDPRHPSTMNNLAIVYGGLKLPGKCVEAWKRAASWGETHPMGNLSIQFIKHGFYDEARKVLDDVPLEHRDNPRVIKAISFLESTNEQEDEELNKHLEAMKVHHKYMLLAVEAEQNPELNQLTPKDLAGDWATASGAELKIDLSEGGDLNAVLTVPTRFSPLAGLIAGTSRSSPSERKFSLNLFKNGLVLTGTGFPLTQERGSTLIGGGSPPNRDYFLVVTGKTNIRGFYSTDYKNPLEISFNRS